VQLLLDACRTKRFATAGSFIDALHALLRLLSERYDRQPFAAVAALSPTGMPT
jgi:hypothetical protein